MRSLLKSTLPLFLPIQYHGPRNRRSIYLTFDDGPTPNTRVMLDVLARHEVKATFFILGKRIVDRDEIVREVHNQGHAIGNHSFSHPSARAIDANTLREDMHRCTEEILRVVPTWHNSICRPPFGDLSIGFFQYAMNTKQRIIQWSRDSLDYRAKSADDIRVNLRGLDNGDIVLFHDEFKVTSDALDMLIPQWQAEGFEFETL